MALSAPWRWSFHSAAPTQEVKNNLANANGEANQLLTQAQRQDFQQAQAQQQAGWIAVDTQALVSTAQTIVSAIEAGASSALTHVEGWVGALGSWVENHPLNAALTGASLTPIAGNFIAAGDDAYHGHWGWALVNVGFVALDFDGMGEAEAAARVAKDVAEDAVKATAENAAKMEIHHLLPQEFASYFRAKGLDPEDYTIELRQDVHRLKPNGLHAGLRLQSWNGQWKQWITAHPEAREGAILRELAKLREQFGI